MSRYFTSAFLVSVCLLGVACSKDVHKIKTRKLNHKNPTTYVFTGALPEVREKIRKTVDDDYERRQELESFLSPNNQSFSVSVKSREEYPSDHAPFNNPEYRDDLIVHSWGEPMDPSEVYYGGGKPLRYRAEFQLHLTSPEENKTQISVITNGPSVINGSVCCGLHGYKSNDVAVEPTTIEEYKILLFIGRLLGVSDMPPLRLPEGKPE